MGLRAYGALDHSEHRGHEDLMVTRTASRGPHGPVAPMVQSPCGPVKNACTEGPVKAEPAPLITDGPSKRVAPPLD